MAQSEMLERLVLIDHVRRDMDPAEQARKAKTAFQKHWPKE